MSSHLCIWGRNKYSKFSKYQLKSSLSSISQHLLGQTEDLLPSAVTLSMVFPKITDRKGFNLQLMYVFLLYKFKQAKFSEVPSEAHKTVHPVGRALSIFETGTHYSPANERAINQSDARQEQAGSDIRDGTFMTAPIITVLYHLR